MNQYETKDTCAEKTILKPWRKVVKMIVFAMDNLSVMKTGKHTSDGKGTLLHKCRQKTPKCKKFGVWFVLLFQLISLNCIKFEAV